MTLSIGQSIAMILVVAICTFLTRVAPFLIFGGDKALPPAISYLGNILPPAIMAALIIYCLKSINFLNFPSGIPEIISIGVVALLHLWKHNALLSISVGTVCYMFLIQVIFA